MEPWFLASVVGATLAGISNFAFKIAAKRNYNSELFSLYGGLNSIFIAAVALWFVVEPLGSFNWQMWLMLLAGALASVAGIGKIYALRFIDSTIYFPLFKLIAPLLAIAAGVVLFAERFTLVEWLGMVLGLLVPLMLINSAENTRQQNLTMGLVLVLLTGVLSAAGAVFGKLVIDTGMTSLQALLYLSIGIFITSLLLITQKVGVRRLRWLVQTDSSVPLVGLAIIRSTLISVTVWLMYYAFSVGGPLAVVQTIHSMYILIPIVLAIIFYQEHWNLQKALAIILSVAALALLG